MNIPRTALLLAVLALCFKSALSQPVDRPQWKVGDKWVFQQTAEGRDATVEWSREVAATAPDGNLTVTSERDQRMTFDRSGNRLDPRGSDFSAVLFTFPMEVGKTWSRDLKIQGEHWNGTENQTWTVRTRETLSVPAGTFECFRLEGSVWRNWTDSRQIGQSFNKSHTEWINWYCPEIQWFAKNWIRTQDAPWLPYVVRESVLISYTRKP